MNRSKSFVLFVLFLACFIGALTLKFQYFVLDRDESVNAQLILGGVTLCGGIFLGLSLQALNHAKSIARAMIEGICLSFFGLLGISAVEASLSDQSYLASVTPAAFSVLDGHCGVYAGRSVFKLIHGQQEPPNKGKYREFVINDRCRLAHLAFLMKHKVSLCDAAEDPIDCQIRWMMGVAEHGYWNRNTRKYFFDQVMNVWPDSKKEESLVNYVLKDQEFESGRQSILRQAGIEETMNDRALLIQEREELENLMLTKEVFTTVAPMLTDVKVNPPPYLFKFKESQDDSQTKMAKIPDVEKEIQALEVRSKR